MTEKEKAGFQGMHGAFSDIAGRRYFDGNVLTVPYESFERMMEAVSRSNCTYAILPIENTVAGSIYQNYDLLGESGLAVVGEVSLRIKHNLLVTNQPPLDQQERIAILKKVGSHFKALEQCIRFFRDNPHIQQSVEFDTAGYAEVVAKQGTIYDGAIASKTAARLYRLHVLRENIEDNPNNITRFLVVGREKQLFGQKASIRFTLKHEPGSLSRAIAAFAREGLNLTKIESRPLIGSPFEYLFYLDFETGNDMTRTGVAIESLGMVADSLDILGYYDKGGISQED
ncbi:hypothetical protein HYT02_03215 [Candidatus Gottesmanbacteria bacterium]|nr:hypothetical protein [Candidatus Gottesmanbacteria bacterium]